MTNAVYILGIHTTPVRRWPEKSFKELTREAYLGALADAGLESGRDIAGAWFGSVLMHYWGQAALRGNICFIPLVRDGLFPDRAPIVNVEGGCATGSLAIAGAAKEIRAGDADLTLAVGVEKLYDPADPGRILPHFDANDAFDPQEWQDHYAATGAAIGQPFAPAPGRTINMDTYAMQALLHMKRHGSTAEQIAAAAAKNHCNGAKNPRAQYRFAMTTDEVLADRMVSAPLTRAMCAPIGDGAGAALLCSERYLRAQPTAVRARAIRIAGLGLSGGKYREPEEPSLTRHAAEIAYARAGRTPRDIDLAEVHDATAFCELYQCEMMGFCGPGEGGDFVGAGETAIGGSLPVNTSGGLVSKGHPIAATGLSMAHELAIQLRGEAGGRQVPDAAIALQENGGGVIGLEEAVAAVLVYERAG
ncbi:thiolase family protein [Marinibaculum pumilum]|uniref:propanoyl-CoA C-acyltransferase n=1 Tax=Marinibaculum pumilum TaxID=1766165 RepID=A0ABV7L078_9PROT